MFDETGPELITLAGIHRQFGSTIAVRDVSISFRQGEILALLGHNGAGKSTLMNIVSGIDGHDRGTIFLDGREVRSWSASRSVAAGVVMVHQHFKLVPGFSIAENLAMASDRMPRLFSPSQLRAFAQRTIDQSGIRMVHPDRRVSELSVGEQSKLELIKALSRTPRLLILDEPTSVLTAAESEELFAIVRMLASRGVAVVVVTHKLSEVMAVAERVVVMRDGRVVLDEIRGSISRADIARAMHMPAEGRPRSSRRPPGEPMLELRQVSTRPPQRALPLRDLSLSVRRGEIVAVVGAAGNGQQELARLARGLIQIRAGSVLIGGKEQDRSSLYRHAGVAHIPPDRSTEGVVSDLSLAENLALRIWTSRSVSRSRAESVVERFGIRASSVDQPAGSLSGGNQQKLLLGRELERQPALIVASDPTRGLDPGAAEMIRTQLASAADSGAAVLLITADTDEALQLADGIHVLYRGEISERLDPARAARELGTRMAGIS